MTEGPWPKCTFANICHASCALEKFVEHSLLYIPHPQRHSLRENRMRCDEELGDGRKWWWSAKFSMSISMLVALRDLFIDLIEPKKIRVAQNSLLEVERKTVQSIFTLAFINCLMLFSFENTLIFFCPRLVQSICAQISIRQKKKKKFTTKI